MNAAWKTAQATALAYPCLLGIETAHPRYAHRAGGGFTVVLSVNRGYE